MGRSRDLKKRIHSLEERLREHHAKIAGEEKKEFPNHNRIRCWEREVQKYKLQIERAVRRLEGTGKGEWLGTRSQLILPPCWMQWRQSPKRLSPKAFQNTRGC
jgi:chromosome segregation ATPase